MNILMPAVCFTDNPRSAHENVLWNFSNHLVNKGHKIFVVSTSVVLKKEVRKNLKKKGLYVYRIYNYQTHGINRVEAFMIFMFSLMLRIFHKFDWIFNAGEGYNPFYRFKLGAKVATRVLGPETAEAKKIFDSEDWKYDRDNKGVGNDWEREQPPRLYRFISFIVVNVWYKLFPMKGRLEEADILFCEGWESLKYCREANRPNPVYLPLGIDYKRFDDPNVELVDTKGKFVYLFTGPIYRRKGIYYLVDAFKQLAVIYPDIELWIVGDGSGELMEKFKHDIKGFEDRIKVLGFKGGTELVKYMKSCQVMIDPMIWANFSSVALEALYCKRPLIGAFWGNTKDFVKDGHSGFLVDSRDVPLLKKRMEYYYNNYDQAQEMGQRGHEFVKKYLTWDKVIQIVDDNFRLFNDQEKIKALNYKYENYDY